MNKIKQILALVVYYTLANKLPNNNKYINWGVRIRRFLINNIFFTVGKNVNIARNVYFGRGDKLSIGNNSGIGEGTYITLLDKVIIGNDVMISPQVMILTGGHKTNDVDVLLRKQPQLKAPVIIEDNVWIGSRAILLPGIRISTGSVIAAGAVVTKDVPPFSISGGVPAKVIKYREHITKE